MKNCLVKILSKILPNYLPKTNFIISNETIRKLNPSIPVEILKPDLVYNQTKIFIQAFPGKVMYAVKCNPSKTFLKLIYKAGVRSFDAASIYEVSLIYKLFRDAKIYFMHPIKSPEDIFLAYHKYKVNSFVIDYIGEFKKILNTLPEAKNLNIYVRIAVPKGNVATDFSTKFGAKSDEAVELLKVCGKYTKNLGVSFHVGTQCTDPEVYYKAIKYAAKIIEESSVKINSLDVGGGFPADLDVNKSLPEIKEYMKPISRALKETGLDKVDLICEAGRALVADGSSLIVRIEGRKNNILYINDGTYGSLFEAGGSIGLSYPVKLIPKIERQVSDELTEFCLAGPTCDSVDMMKGPFILPRDSGIGDWIIIDKLGAYSQVSRTNFNGFGRVQKISFSENF